MGIEDHSKNSIMGVYKNNTRPTSFTSTDSSSHFCTHCNNTKHTIYVFLEAIWLFGGTSLINLKGRTINQIRLLLPMLLL